MNDKIKTENEGSFTIDPLKNTASITDHVGNKLIMRSKEPGFEIKDATDQSICTTNRSDDSDLASPAFKKSLRDLSESLNPHTHPGETGDKMLGALAEAMRLAKQAATTGVPVEVHPGDIASFCKPKNKAPRQH